MRYFPPLRIGIPLLLLSFGGLAGVIAYIYDRKAQDELIEQETGRYVKFLGEKLGGMMSHFMGVDQPAGAEREVALTGARPGARYVTILDAEDRVLFSSREGERRVPLASSVAAGSAGLVEQVRKRGEGLEEVTADRSRITGAYPFPITKPGAPHAGGSGVAVIEIDLAARKAEVAAVDLRRTQIEAAVLLGLTILFSIIFHRTLTNRVNRLVRATAALARGDMGATASLEGKDELAVLSKAFDSMAAQIRVRDEELVKSEQRFRQLAENVDEIFWLYDFPTRQVLFVNPAFEKIFGIPGSVLSASSTAWQSAIHPEDRDRVLKAFADEREAKRETEYRIIRPDGGVRWLRDRSFPIPHAGGRAERVAGIAQDITERKHAEEEREAFERKLQETQRLESLGVLAGGIAHDFNNLLTGVLGNASLARMSLTEADKCQNYLSEIEEVAVRAADLCKQMLAYSGRGRFEVTLLNFNALIQETTQLLKHSTAKTATLRFHLADDLPPIEGDATQLRQVVMNLVINASEAFDENGGTISLTTGLVRVDSDYLQSMVLAQNFPAGDYVFLDVADNGSGMSAETQARIFEPFYTTKFTGRGLGLSAVLGIVRGHRGAMKVYSEPGKGSLFKLLFPIASGQARKHAGDVPKATKWRGSGTILIVDDEEPVRIVSARMIESFGFQVDVACDGLEAVELFKKMGGNYRAVLMDLTMPRLDGEAASRRLHALDPNVRLVLMSGFNEQEATQRFAGTGLSGFLQKPFKLDQLAAKLSSILAES